MKKFLLLGIVICALFLIPSAMATGGWYIGDRFYTHEELDNEYVCIGEADGIADVKVTEVRVVAGRIVVTIEVTCNDGSTEIYTMVNDTEHDNPNSGYIPDQAPDNTITSATPLDQDSPCITYGYYWIETNEDCAAYLADNIQLRR